MDFEVRYEYDQIRIIVFTGPCHLSLSIQDPEDAEALAIAFDAIPSERSCNVNIDQQQSVSLNRHGKDDISFSIGRDDDYLDVYLPHLSEENCRHLSLYLRQGVEKLQAHKDEEAERHLSRRR
jgi:hypothetical protein